jgi:hypothetical protein
VPFANRMIDPTIMKKIIVLSFWVLRSAITNGQHFSADKLMAMLHLTTPEIEKQLLKKKYYSTGTLSFSDTAITTYQYRAVKSKKIPFDTVNRKYISAVLNETHKQTYQTTSATEYYNIIEALKQKGFYCEYEKDSSLTPHSYLFQYHNYTADASINRVAETTWYSIAFHKKDLPVEKDVHFAEDLLQFNSHEYLVYYFGEENVKKDIYYFGENDIVKCSVLLINTRLQVIFIWKDELNRRKISKLFFGGIHTLKSQKGNSKFIAENGWLLKSNIYAGMPLVNLRILNEKNFAFSGGDSPNPGLIFPESSGRVDFSNVDVILACMNCDDDKFLKSKLMNADKAMQDGRALFILTIVLYPDMLPIFD